MPGHEASRALVPLVVPGKVPPAAGMTVLERLQPLLVRAKAPRPYVKATSRPVSSLIWRSNTATLGIPVSGPMGVQLPPPSMLFQTPTSVPTYTVAGADGSTTTVLWGRFTGGLTFDHMGEVARALVVLKTCPG